MDFNNNMQNNMPDNMNMMGNMPYPAQPVRERENRMATAALITGILGAFSIICLPLYLPCIFAGISIVLALLSKGSKSKLSAYAKAGLITSVCSLILNLLILAGCYYLVFNIPEFRQEFNQAYEQIYGESFDDLIQDSFER